MENSNLISRDQALAILMLEYDFQPERASEFLGAKLHKWTTAIPEEDVRRWGADSVRLRRSGAAMVKQMDDALDHLRARMLAGAIQTHYTKK